MVPYAVRKEAESSSDWLLKFSRRAWAVKSSPLDMESPRQSWSSTVPWLQGGVCFRTVLAIIALQRQCASSI